MANDRPTDLDIKRQIFRECQGAAEALARAFAGADRAFPILSRDASAIVEQQLADLWRRSYRLIDAVAFGGALTHERIENELALQGIDGGGDGGGEFGHGGRSASSLRASGLRAGDGGGVLSRVADESDLDRTPKVTTERLFHGEDLTNGAVVCASSQIGVKETGPNSGPMVDQYLDSVGLEPGLSWCAAGVYWSFQMASNAIDMLNPCPRTGSVLRMWEMAPDATKVQEPVRGSIFITDHGKGHGHCGIVEAVNGGGLIETIEFNTNRGGSRNGDCVARHIWRPSDGVRGSLLGYIDLALVPLVSRKPAAV